MELTVQMVPMLILAALVCGWVANAAIASGGRGLLIDMAVGLAGSGVAGGLLWSVTGQTAFATLAMFVAGLCGAAAGIAVQRHFWPAAPMTWAARGLHPAGGRPDSLDGTPGEAGTSLVDRSAPS